MNELMALSAILGGWLIVSILITAAICRLICCAKRKNNENY